MLMQQLMLQIPSLPICLHLDEVCICKTEIKYYIYRHCKSAVKVRETDIFNKIRNGYVVALRPIHKIPIYILQERID